MHVILRTLQQIEEDYISIDLCEIVTFLSTFYPLWFLIICSHIHTRTSASIYKNHEVKK